MVRERLPLGFVLKAPDQNMLMRPCLYDEDLVCTGKDLLCAAKIYSLQARLLAAQEGKQCLTYVQPAGSLGQDGAG